MIIHLYIKPSTLMDNSPRESLGKIEKDNEFTLSANINTEDSRLEWVDESLGIIKVMNKGPHKK
jgi:hypothetical protein